MCSFRLSRSRANSGSGVGRLGAGLLSSKLIGRREARCGPQRQGLRPHVRGAARALIGPPIFERCVSTTDLWIHRSQTMCARLRSRSANLRTGCWTKCSPLVARCSEFKEVLPHGDFGEWLTTEFGWKERTAQSYMRVAGSFGENPQRVLDLPLRSVYTLAAQPHSTRSRILDLVDEGKRPDEKAIASIIREDRWERQEAAARQREEQRRAKLTPEERQREDNARARASTRKANEAAKREQERLALEKQRQAQEAAAHEAASLIARSIPTCIDL